MPADPANELRLTIMRLARHMRRQKAEGDVTDGQRSVLFALEENGEQSLGSLSERERVTPPSMNRTVGALVELGYVTRETAADDGRRVTITITAPGVKFVRETRRCRDEWFSSRLATLTPDERSIIERAAPILKSLADR
jgi:DNA-binding MarR family transcriptional regulator